MNKKFLNAVLFGALLASSTGTFTSCKDYDDDINGLSGRVDAIEKTLADLNTKFGSLAYVKSVSFADGKLVVPDQSGTATTFIIPDKDTPDTNTTYTLGVSQDGNKATITLTDDKGNKQTKEISFTDNDTKFDPTGLKVGADGVTVEYNGVPTSITLPKQLNKDLTIVKFEENGVTFGWSIKYGDAEPTNLMITDVLPMTGFSFEPDVLLGGVPSMKALSVVYNAWTVTTDCATPTKIGEVWKEAATASYISPVIAGTYLLNPSSATQEQIAGITVVSKDIEYVRSAEAAPTVDSYKVKDGVLTVYFKANTEDIKDLANGEITGIKIRVATKAGNVMTDQDYRGVYKTEYTDLILADKNKTAPDHHLYGTTTGKAQDAIDEDPDYEVDFDSKTGLDLKDKVAICYTDAAGNTGKTMSATEMANLGLQYDFHLCNYIDGVNETAQNDFARIDNGVLFPKLFNETSTPYAAVGRMPLVRVQLLTKDKKVVSTGWIKVEITKGKTPALPVNFEFSAFTNQCDAKDFSLTVEQMNVKIYNALGLDRTQFNSLYTIKTISAGNYGQGDGTVALKADPAATTITDLLVWTVDQTDMNAALARTTNMGVLSTVVTYEANDPNSRGNVTVTFTTKVNPIASVTIPESSKILKYWDDKKEYIRLNVAVPDGNNPCTFAVDLDNVFTGNKPTIAGVNTYKYVFDAVKNARKVKGISGTEYTLSVSADGTTLMSGLIAIAVIDADGVVTYQDETIAKDLLNVASHSSVPNGGFFAWVDIIATTGDCDLNLPITNGQFKAYFLRPINVAAGAGAFKDATDGGSTVSKLDLLKFSDWRDYEFSATKNKTYFAFYGITAITVDIANIKTDLNGGDDLLSVVAPDLKITQVAYTDVATPGSVTYKNNGAAVSGFNLTLPVEVSYKWGTVKAYVTIPVEKTQGN